MSNLEQQIMDTISEMDTLSCKGKKIEETAKVASSAIDLGVEEMKKEANCLMSNSSYFPYIFPKNCFQVSQSIENKEVIENNNPPYFNSFYRKYVSCKMETPHVNEFQLNRMHEKSFYNWQLKNILLKETS